MRRPGRACINVIVLLFCAAFAEADASTLRDGDIIFQTSRSSQSRAIRIATGSRYSHMGLILHRGGRPFVLEAVQPVRMTALDAWIRRGENGQYVVKRLKNADVLLTDSALRNMRRIAEAMMGKDYDLAFGWSDDRIYCSELVWKVYQRALGLKIGELQRLGDLDLSHPLVKDKIRERYGSSVPLDEPVISPARMFESGLLLTVLSY